MAYRTAPNSQQLLVPGASPCPRRYHALPTHTVANPATRQAGIAATAVCKTRNNRAGIVLAGWGSQRQKAAQHPGALTVARGSHGQSLKRQPSLRGVNQPAVAWQPGGPRGDWRVSLGPARIGQRLSSQKKRRLVLQQSTMALAVATAGAVGQGFGALATPLIGPADTWGVWAALLVCAAGGLWSEKTTVGKALSGPLVSTLLALVLSNAGVIPCEAPAYSVVNRYLLPLAVPLLLFGADLRRVVRDTGRMLLAFSIGAVATVVGTLVAMLLLPLRSLGGDGWKMAAALMSRHIGGAVNYVAVSEALHTSPSVVAAGLAADNLICALYFTSLFALAAGIPPDPPLSTPSPRLTASNASGRGTFQDDSPPAAGPATASPLFGDHATASGLSPSSSSSPSPSSSPSSSSPPSSASSPLSPSSPSSSLSPSSSADTLHAVAAPPLESLHPLTDLPDNQKAANPSLPTSSAPRVLPSDGGSRSITAAPPPEKDGSADAALYASTGPATDLDDNIGVPMPAEGDITSNARVLEASTALALSAVICAAGAAMAKHPLFAPLGGPIPCVTAVVVVLATVLPVQMGALAPAGEALSTIFMQIFFATVGANGSVAAVLRMAPSLFSFSLIQIAVHLALTLGIGKVLGFELRELLLASNANVGGPTTAAGMATAKGWRTLLVPSILVGIMGYAMATFVSIALGYSWLRRMQ